jgi:hypothetical protein
MKDIGGHMLTTVKRRHFTMDSDLDVIVLGEAYLKDYRHKILSVALRMGKETSHKRNTKSKNFFSRHK